MIRRSNHNLFSSPSESLFEDELCW